MSVCIDFYDCDFTDVTLACKDTDYNDDHDNHDDLNDHDDHDLLTDDHKMDKKRMKIDKSEWNG